MPIDMEPTRIAEYTPLKLQIHGSLSTVIGISFVQPFFLGGTGFSRAGGRYCWGRWANLWGLLDWVGGPHFTEVCLPFGELETSLLTSILGTTIVTQLELLVTQLACYDPMISYDHHDLQLTTWPLREMIHVGSRTCTEVPCHGHQVSWVLCGMSRQMEHFA